MKNNNCGKASTNFMERAAELENLVLTNKTYQSTRFVRALQRGNSTALRNLPTLVSVVSEEYNDAVKSYNATRMSELKPIVDDLTNAKTLFFSIGLSQILECYCVASLEVQYSNHFPIQVCSTMYVLQVILFEINFAIFYTNLSELFCRS